MKFLIHFLGDRIHSYYGSESVGAWVLDYKRLEDIPQPWRDTFDFMLKHGQAVTNSGAYVYQVRTK